MKQEVGMPIKNPHTAHCVGCGKQLAREGERPIWWIQMGNYAYCKKCYEKNRSKISNPV